MAGLQGMPCDGKNESLSLVQDREVLQPPYKQSCETIQMFKEDIFT